tara:strand:+ start:1403 stop:2224 length:822 start_codon:yes stop_codon:yes gene_type:complete
VKNKNSEIWFSILICCYNSEKYINETLNSILNQTYKKFELIIVDDGSLDNTETIIKSFIKKNFKLDIKYTKIKNSGLPVARNKGLELSSNKWIALLDHDDIWENNKLESQAKEIINNPNCNLFFSNFSYLDQQNEYSRFDVAIKYDNYKPYELNLSLFSGYIHLLTKGCFIGSSTCVFNNNLKYVKKFDVKYKFICDYDFFLNYSFYYNMFCSQNNYVKWRVHQNQSTKKLNNILIKELKLLYIKKIFDSHLSFYVKIILLFKYLKLIIKNYI